MTYRPSYADRVERLMGFNPEVKDWLMRNRHDKFYLIHQVWQIRDIMVEEGSAFRATGIESIASALFYVLGWEDWSERADEVASMVREKRERKERRRAKGEEVEAAEQGQMFEIEPVRSHIDTG